MLSVGYDKSTKTIEGVGTFIFNYKGNTMSIPMYLVQDATTIIAENDINSCPGCAVKTIFRDFGTSSQDYHRILQINDEYIPLIRINKTWYLPADLNAYVITSSSIHVNNLHYKLAHADPRAILLSIQKGTLDASDREKADLASTIKNGCIQCMRSKARRADAIEGSRVHYLRSMPFDNVYSDVCIVKTRKMKNEVGCFVTFRDQYTKYVKVYFLKGKDDVVRATKIFVQWVANQFSSDGYRVHRLFTDKGTEYLNTDLRTFLEDHGIEAHTTSGYMSASNGVAERLNLTILNDTRAMLHSGKVSSAFWSDAADYCVFIRNHIYLRKIQNSPAGMLNLPVPRTKDLHQFGEVCVITHPKLYHPKLGERGVEALYLGWSESVYGSHVFIPNTPGDTRYGRFEETRCAQFLKKPVLYTDYISKNSDGEEDTLHALFDPADEIFADIIADNDFNPPLFEQPSTIDEFSDVDSFPMNIDSASENKTNKSSADGKDEPTSDESTSEADKPDDASLSNDSDDDPDWLPGSDDDVDMSDISSTESEDYSDEEHRNQKSEEPQTIQASDEQPSADTAMLFDLDAEDDYEKDGVIYESIHGAKAPKPKPSKSHKTHQALNTSQLSEKAKKVNHTKKNLQHNAISKSSKENSNDIKPTVGVDGMDSLSSGKETHSHNKTTSSVVATPPQARTPVSSEIKQDVPKDEVKSATGNNVTDSMPKQRFTDARKTVDGHEESGPLLNSDSDEGKSLEERKSSPHFTSRKDKPDLQGKPGTSTSGPSKTSSTVTNKNQPRGTVDWTKKTKLTSLAPLRSGRYPRKRSFEDDGFDVSGSSVPSIRNTEGLSHRKLYPVRYKKPRIHQITIMEIDIQTLPKGYWQALSGAEAAEWKDSTHSELSSHEKLTTWDPKPIITNDPAILSRTVPTQWRFTRKADGRYKSRLVARGDRQKPDTYGQTYSPTLRPEIMRTILAHIATHRWYLRQFDVKTAYLNSKIDTKLYIYRPQGYPLDPSIKVPPGKKVVYRLKKALYGLKQSGKLWHETIKAKLGQIGFIDQRHFPSTFVHKNKAGNVDCIVGLFVDDIIIGSSDLPFMEKVTNKLKSAYELKTITPDEKTGIQRFLGIDLNIERDKDGLVQSIELSQTTYIDSVLSRMQISPTRSCASPLSPNFYFEPSKYPMKSTKKELDKAVSRYRQVIGCLLYISVMTRPDIAYAVDYLARFSTYPHPILIKQLIHIMNYLYFSKDKSIKYGLTSSSTTNHLVCYSDSDFAQEPTTRKSMMGFFIMYANAPLYWKCHYTPLVCHSSTEAELQAIYTVLNELKWFHPLMQYLSTYIGTEKVPEIMVDNQSAMDSTVFGNFSTESKAYAVRLMSIREDYERKLFTMTHVASENELADILTKPVTIKVISKLRKLIVSVLRIKKVCRN